MKEKTTTKLEDDVLKFRKNVVTRMKEMCNKEEQEEIMYYVNLIKKIFRVSDSISLDKEKDYTIWAVKFVVKDSGKKIDCEVDIGKKGFCNLTTWPFELSETKAIRRAIMNLEGAAQYASITILTDIAHYFEDLEGYSGVRAGNSIMTISIDRTVFEKEEASE